MTVTGKYVSFTQRHPIKIVLTGLACVVVAAPFMFKLGSTTTDSFDASPGTQSYTETNLIKSQFPGDFNDMESLLMKCEACAASDFQDVLDSLSNELSHYAEDGTLVSITSFFTYNNTDLSVLAKGYYNETAGSMIASLEFDVVKGDSAVSDAVTAALDAIKTINKESPVSSYLTGQTASRLLATEQAGKFIGMADGTGMIFIVLLFGWQVRSWRLTLIPIFNTVLCLIISEGLIYPLSKSGVITLPSYVPNVCLFLSIALSVDYSFFHLVRFQEKRREGAGLEEAVEAMVTTAGRVVLVSGVVLLFTWLALAFFPVFGTDTLGYCAAITIFVCICVNLTMNPALIFLFPRFFDNAAQDACRCCRRRSRTTAELPLAQPTEPTDPTKNCYGRVANVITRMPCLIIVPLIVYALLIPGAVRIFTADLVVGGINGGTKDTEYATNQILLDFPDTVQGAPLTIFLSAEGTVKSDEYFNQSCRLAKGVSDATGIPLSQFRGATILQENCLPWASADYALAIPIYAYAWDRAVNADNNSALLTVTLPFDAFSNEAKALVKKSREAVDEFMEQPYGQAAIFHPMAVEVDAEALVQRRFPWAVLITLIVVFTVIAIRYGAALIPVKLFFTIALPIISVLGTGAFVFQDGALNWTHIPSLKSQGGLVWINPVACTFMLIGFALDYDLFLFSRIYADRKEGRFLDDRSAIVHAVAQTGPVITTAGVIMALAFSGMVVQSSNPFLCQMGFTMIFGILMDTFVVRTFLVPALLMMAGRYNWWPGKMPTEAAAH